MFVIDMAGIYTHTHILVYTSIYTRIHTTHTHTHTPHTDNTQYTHDTHILVLLVHIYTYLPFKVASVRIEGSETGFRLH